MKPPTYDELVAELEQVRRDLVVSRQHGIWLEEEIARLARPGESSTQTVERVIAELHSLRTMKKERDIWGPEA